MRLAFSLGLLATFVAWTAAVQAGWLTGLDAGLRAPRLEPLSPAGQIWGGIAVVTYPAVTYAALIVAASWAWQRRLRNLAVACLLAIPTGWLSTEAMKRLVRRARPDSPMNVLITAHGYSYPSGHTVAATVVATVIMAVVLTTRQRRSAIRLARVIGVAFVLLVGLDRWAVSSHWFSDLVGSLLWAGTVVAFVLLACRVHYLEVPWHAHQPADTPTGGQKAAVVYNPSKVGDLTTFRQRLEYELRIRGWDHPTYHETTIDDPGYGITRSVVELNPDLVLGAGGDGTVREICSALAGTGVPLGLLPAGTTNLLARNLGISLDETDALRTALDGARSRIDLVRVVPDGDETRATHLDVMGGVGIDAATFANTDDELKSTIGHAAYAVAAARQWQENPATFRATLRLDDGAPEQVDASMITIGNVGNLQGGFRVLPGAKPDDGLLNVAVFTQDSVAQWIRLATDVLGRRDDLAGTDERTARRVSIELDKPVPFELDGDAVGECATLTAEIQPGVLTIMMPRRD